MLNMTTFANELFTKTTESGLQQIGNVFLPSVLIIWLLFVLLTFIIGLCTLKKWKKFVLIFVLPQIVFLVMILLIFKFPLLIQWSTEWIR